ncbi:carboxypeptidase regulatory-like domain-containing protein, partial [candidate division WWE3 bacterium]|nr:carboxypeptidase regulatory-like domain-containing protein [candidate division WWE3 bacterium]
WTTLRVDNPNVFLSTGTQDVNFSPPREWRCQREKGFRIRCRISALSGISEGGANTTDKVKFNLKALVGTGTITASTLVGALDSAVTANDAGTYTILQPTTSATGLIPIEMTVKSVRDISKVDVILDSTSAGAGDTVDLTGEDLDGNALTETIDVSSGNGTYTSTLAYADITQVDCNGFTDGTTQVDQKKWGAIEAVNYRTYLINYHLHAGNGSTTTAITALGENIMFLPGAIWQVEKATFTLGALVGSGDTEDAYRGCVLSESLGSAANQLGIGADLTRFIGTTSNNFNFYGSHWQRIEGAYSGPLIRGVPGNTGTINIRHSRLSGFAYGGGSRGIYDNNDDITLYKTRINLDWQWTGGTYSVEGVALSDNSRPFGAEIGSNSLTLKNVEINDNGTLRIWFYTSTGKLTMLSCPISTSRFQIGYSGAGTGVRKIDIGVTYDLTVRGEDGSAVSSASVVITDDAGTEITNTTTDANGVITQQQLIAYWAKYTALDPSITWTALTPFTIVVKKDGFRVTKKYIYIADTTTALKQNIVDKVTLVRQRIAIDQEAEL